MLCECVCARSFISFIVELKGVRLIRGLPRGVSSLVECTVVGADVAAVRAYSVVSMVRLGMISCTYLLWSAYCSVVWCGDSEGSVHRCVEDVAPPACGWTCSPLTCRWTLPHFGINSCACHKWLWSLDTKKKNKSCLLSCKHVINFWYCLSRKAQEILEIMSNSSNSSNTVTGSMLNSIVQLSNDLCSNGKICIWCIPGYVCEIYSVFSLFCFHIASTSVTFTFSLCLTTHLPSPPTHRPTSSIFVLPIPFLRCCSSPAVCLSKMGILYVLRKIV